jgi:hypothetical protein
MREITRLLVVILFLTCGFAKASYEYREISTFDGTTVTGQLIEVYEDRWFWEPSEGAESYIGLFSNQEGGRFHFINSSEIQSQRAFSRPESTYDQYLRKNDLYLKQAPLDGWNFITTGNEGHHKYEIMSGNFAWDIVKIKNGRSYQLPGTQNPQHHVWSETLYSPLQGTVHAVARYQPDGPPDPTLSKDLSGRGDGNYIVLHVHGPFYFVFLHLKRDSIPSGIQVGAQVLPGDVLGEIGNSGVSFVPHLHMTMYYKSKDLEGRFVSVPTLMNHIEMMSSSLSPPVPVCAASPRAGQQIRTHE